MQLHQPKRILTSVTHAAEAAVVTVVAQVVAMVAVVVAVVVTRATVQVDAQVVAMVAVAETASLATSRSAASTAHAKQQYFLGIAADSRVCGDASLRLTVN